MSAGTLQNQKMSAGNECRDSTKSKKIKNICTSQKKALTLQPQTRPEGVRSHSSVG